MPGSIRTASTRNPLAALGVLSTLLLCAARVAAGPVDQRVEDAAFFERHPAKLTASTGVDFSTGDYGTNTDTDIWNVPTSLKLDWEPVILRVTVPYVRIRGSGSVIGPNGIPIDSTSTNTETNEGLGDVIASLTGVYYPARELAVLPVVELTGKVKFPTADEDEGLGTGKTDYTLQLDVSKQLGPVTPFGTFGHRWVGDPSNFRLVDKYFASAGLSLRVHRRLSLGLAYDWSQSASPGRPDAHELFPFASLGLGDHFAIDPYAVIGLSEPTPDFALGLRLRAFVRID